MATTNHRERRSRFDDAGYVTVLFRGGSGKNMLVRD